MTCNADRLSAICAVSLELTATDDASLQEDVALGLEQQLLCVTMCRQLVISSQ